VIIAVRKATRIKNDKLMADILDQLAEEVDKIPEDEIASPRAKKAVTKKTPDDAIVTSSLMDQLLEKESASYPQIGDSISGTVIEVSSNELYLDLNPFGTGIVLGKEIKDGLGNGKLKIGDEITATVIDIENEDGFIELSIREASYEKAWDGLESKRDTQEKVTTRIISANKGGLLIEVNGISGFLPVSQLSSKNYPRVEDGDKNKILALLKKLVGQEMEVRILDADRETQKLIVSEKAAQSEKDKEVISSLSVGDVVDGEVSGVVDFGAFIKFSTISKNPEGSTDEKKLEGLVHISELAWQLIEDPRAIVKVGEKVQAKIIGLDSDKISLSIRALQKDPWSDISEKYSVGDIVSGTVNKINHFGAFVYLDKDIHGLAHISEMSEAHPGKNIDELIKAGEKYSWKILSIEPKDHRMGLVLVNKKEAGSKKEKKAAPKEEKDKTAKEDAIEETEVKTKPKKEKGIKKESIAISPEKNIEKKKVKKLSNKKEK
jgi:small subunit ribosomal protein S1